MDEVAKDGDRAEQAADTPGPLAGPVPGEHPDVTAWRAAVLAGAGQLSGTTVAVPAAEAAEGPQPPPESGRSRRLLYVTLPGCWGALIFACLSFTPSLLPRGGVVQGVVSGNQARQDETEGIRRREGPEEGGRSVRRQGIHRDGLHHHPGWSPASSAPPAAMPGTVPAD